MFAPKPDAELRFSVNASVGPLPKERHGFHDIYYTRSFVSEPLLDTVLSRHCSFQTSTAFQELHKRNSIGEEAERSPADAQSSDQLSEPERCLDAERTRVAIDRGRVANPAARVYAVQDRPIAEQRDNADPVILVEYVAREERQSKV